MKTFWKKCLSIILGFLISLIICEIILLIHNPFPFAISKGKLVLPSNQRAIFKNTWIKKLDSNIYYSKNALGFRGPLPKDSINKLLSIICIGGSTTECHYISDSLTWPYQLYTKLKDTIPQVWLNNAGVDGHSTFGHLLLLKEYIARLKPKYVIFLIGINDIENDKPQQFDLMNEKKINFLSPKSFLKSVANKTELGSTLFQLYAIRGAYKKGLIHKEIGFAELKDTVLPQVYMDSIIKRQHNYLENYRKRIEEMITICEINNVKPIMLTQPSMFGNYFDSTLMINLGNKNFPDAEPYANSILMEKVLELYNDVVRSFGSRVKLIDLAKLLPKKSSLYYDFVHFTNEGCAEVSSILSAELTPFLKVKF